MVFASSEQAAKLGEEGHSMRLQRDSRLLGCMESGGEECLKVTRYIDGQNDTPPRLQASQYE